MKSNAALWRRLILLVPFITIVGSGLVKELIRVGPRHLEAFHWQIGIMYALFLVGGVIGYWLVSADLVLKRYKISVPGTEDAMSQWGRAIRNVLTCAILGVLGIWVITSSGSPVGWGVVFGLQLRLFTELAFSADYSSWYWIFARPFSIREHKVFLLVWAGALLAQWLVLL